MWSCFSAGWWVVTILYHHSLPKSTELGMLEPLFDHPNVAKKFQIQSKRFQMPSFLSMNSSQNLKKRIKTLSMVVIEKV
jgi:hypothetical protein